MDSAQLNATDGERKRKFESRMVAVFSQNEVIGVEEILKTHVLKYMRYEKQKAMEQSNLKALNRLEKFDLEEDAADSLYNFTA